MPEPAMPASVLPGAAAQFKALYNELRRLAHGQMYAQARTTLCTTALVHEAYLRVGGKPMSQDSREGFLALAAKAMRCVLVDHVRARLAAKRGAGAAHTNVDNHEPAAPDRTLDLIEVAQALDHLDTINPRLVSVVECRFFAGMEFGEIGQVLGLCERTVQRDWRCARAYLETYLNRVA
jgi:RNA polymerase sigma factor (TIGR02999 family)